MQSSDDQNISQAKLYLWVPLACDYMCKDCGGPILPTFRYGYLKPIKLEWSRWYASRGRKQGLAMFSRSVVQRINIKEDTSMSHDLIAPWSCQLMIFEQVHYNNITNTPKNMRTINLNNNLYKWTCNPYCICHWTNLYLVYFPPRWMIIPR